MHSSTILFAALGVCVSAACAQPGGLLTHTNRDSFTEHPTRYTAGFENPTIESSAGGHATCISGYIKVKASAMNVNINLEEPKNNTQVTQLMAEKLQVNSTLQESLITGEHPVSGTFSIYSQLCVPSVTGSITKSPLQFLVHGAGFDRSYWNILPGYSYVDYAAQRGYTTFLYDRLGNGRSDHPEPIQTLQTAIQVSITHELIQMLRHGDISSHKFDKILGVGHSYGSAQIAGVTSLYPKDFDAVVLTGFSADGSGMPVAFAGVGLAIAANADPNRFSDLPNGYLTSTYIEGNQFFFFREPEFDPKLLYHSEATKQTLSLGEYLAFGHFDPASDFTGPIYVVNGENDMPNCFGNCLVPFNKVADVMDKLYPSASKGSGWYLVPRAGHGINFHYGADDAFDHIHRFFKKNGF